MKTQNTEKSSNNLNQEMLCPFCRKANMKLKQDSMEPENVEFECLVCPNCKESILTGKQMYSLAKKYRALRKAKPAKFAKWGNSIAVRIPQEIVSEYKIKPGQNASITKEKNGIKIVPE